MSNEAKVGIIVGATLGVLCLMGMTFLALYIKQNKRNRSSNYESDSE